MSWGNFALMRMKLNDGFRSIALSQTYSGNPAKANQGEMGEIMQTTAFAYSEKENLPDDKRLKAIIPLWLPHYHKFSLPEDIQQKLLKISPATIDRVGSKIIKKHDQPKTRGFCNTTEPH